MPNLLQTAETAGFKTLLSLVTATDLTDTLNSPGPYTVLAPTDEAFAKLPPGTLEGLQKDIPTLKRIVAYHVFFGDVRSDDLAEIDEAPTVEGSVVGIERADGGIKINDAKVTQTDILTDNGVIHVIDTVLMPGLVVAESAQLS